MINKYVLFIILMLLVGSSFLLYDNFESITFSTVSESTTTTKLKNSTSSTTTTVPEITNIIVTVSNDGSGSEYFLNG